MNADRPHERAELELTFWHGLILNFVIPGCVSKSAIADLDAQARNPYTPMVVMDSGLAPSGRALREPVIAPRNDDLGGFHAPPRIFLCILPP
jgi:hypothetical protein